MPYVGETISIPRTGWQDIEKVTVEKSLDGGPYVAVETYEVPREIVTVGEEEELVYTFNYQYTFLPEDVGNLTFRFTTLPPAPVVIFSSGPVVVDVQITGTIIIQSFDAVISGVGIKIVTGIGVLKANNSEISSVGYITGEINTYEIPSNIVIEESSNEEYFVVADQIIDEFSCDKEWMTSLDSRLPNNSTLSELISYSELVNNLDILMYDIKGRYRSENYIDCGPYEIDGTYNKTINRYVDTFSAKETPGNDGYCNLLLHLDQDPIIDKSANQYLPILHGIQIREGYAIIKSNGYLQSPCYISLTEGFSIEFRMKIPNGGTWRQDLGVLVFPLYLECIDNTITLIVEDITSIILGDYNSYYHFAFQYEGQYLTFYVNGIQVYEIQIDLGDIIIDNIILGTLEDLIINNGEIHIQELRISNTTRWDSSFDYPGEGVHYEDYGKLGWYYNPMSQYHMEKQLQQIIAKNEHIYNIFGDGLFWKDQKLLYPTPNWYIEGIVRLVGHQADGRGIPIIEFHSINTDAKKLCIDTVSSLYINGILIFWDVYDATYPVNLFSSPVSEEVIQIHYIGTSALQASNSVINGVGIIVGT